MSTQQAQADWLRQKTDDFRKRAQDIISGREKMGDDQALTLAKQMEGIARSQSAKDHGVKEDLDIWIANLRQAIKARSMRAKLTGNKGGYNWGAR